MNLGDGDLCKRNAKYILALMIIRVIEYPKGTIRVLDIELNHITSPLVVQNDFNHFSRPCTGPIVYLYRIFNSKISLLVDMLLSLKDKSLYF